MSWLHPAAHAPAAAVPPATLPLTAAQLQACWPRTRDAAGWLAALAPACERFGITTPLRLAAFLAQTGHESGDGTALSEDMRYSTAARLRQVYPSRFPTLAAAAPYVGQPEMLANLVYGGRYGNGPASSGDGWRFRGGGLIQLTFRSGYERLGAALGMTAEQAADYARTRDGAAMSAAWYAADRGLLAAADAGDFDKVACLTAGQASAAKVIGLADRRARYARCRAALVPTRRAA